LARDIVGHEVKTACQTGWDVIKGYISAVIPTKHLSRADEIGTTRTIETFPLTRKLTETDMPLAAKRRAPAAETEIRALVEDIASAIRCQDADALIAHYAPDVLAFDLLLPLQYEGVDALKKRASQWLASFEGPVGFEMRNLRITAGDDVAFCHSLNGVKGTSQGGAQVDMWWRATICFSRRDAKWRVAHAHSSEPFDMQSGKALLDLTP
jgi:uncharacterized protein (TIGR02246 family)